MMSLPAFSALLAVWLWCFASVAAASSEGLHSVTGQLLFPFGMARPEIANIQVLLQLQGGQQQRAFAKADASFAFQRVPAGQHTMEPSCVGYLFPSVRVNVASSGSVSLAYAEFPEQSLSLPLVLRAAQVDYFDPVNRFDLMAFLRSPMGILAAFMVFAMFLSPYLKVDPEELEAYQKEIEDAKTAKAQKALRSSEAARLPAAPLPAGGGTGAAPRLGGGTSSARQRNKK